MRKNEADIMHPVRGANVKAGKWRIQNKSCVSSSLQVLGAQDSLASGTRIIFATMTERNPRAQEYSLYMTKVEMSSTTALEI